MVDLDGLTVADLRDALWNVEGTKPTLRLFAAIAYKNGVTQTELASWFDVERRTIYGWLARLDGVEPPEIASAVVDANRSGRPRKLPDEERRAFAETVREPPTAAGIDARAWTPALVRTFVADRYDVDYSLPSCRRLLRAAGLRYRRPDAPVDECDPVHGESVGDDSDTGAGWWLPP